MGAGIAANFLGLPPRWRMTPTELLLDSEAVESVCSLLVYFLFIFILVVGRPRASPGWETASA
jgi:hypothetical protein